MVLITLWGNYVINITIAYIISMEAAKMIWKRNWICSLLRFNIHSDTSVPLQLSKAWRACGRGSEAATGLACAQCDVGAGFDSQALTVCDDFRYHQLFIHMSTEWSASKDGRRRHCDPWEIESLMLKRQKRTSDSIVRLVTLYIWLECSTFPACFRAIIPGFLLSSSTFGAIIQPPYPWFSVLVLISIKRTFWTEICVLLIPIVL